MSPLLALAPAHLLPTMSKVKSKERTKGDDGEIHKLIEIQPTLSFMTSNYIYDSNCQFSRGTATFNPPHSTQASVCVCVCVFLSTCRCLV